MGMGVACFKLQLVPQQPVCIQCQVVDLKGELIGLGASVAAAEAFLDASPGLLLTVW